MCFLQMLGAAKQASAELAAARKEHAREVAALREQLQAAEEAHSKVGRLAGRSGAV